MSEHSATPWSTIHQFIFSGDHAIPIASGHKEYATGPNGELYVQAQANAAFIVKAVNSHEALKASLAEMVGVYWGDGDGIEPSPACIQRALAVLASIEENV